MVYVRYPLLLRQVEDIFFERGIDISHETVRFWWNRFGPLFASEIRRRRVRQRSYSLWRAVDHKGEVIEVFASSCLVPEIDGSDFV